VGCIFAELLERKAAFAGKDYVHQLNLITRVSDCISHVVLYFTLRVQALPSVLPAYFPTIHQSLLPRTALDANQASNA
jgi:hypothetical protein